ncbi:hypothetical protein [Lacrimispora sp. 38-1]|uniref:hypothetical protein n=1 Tax=Lacrimispora sp. 38-1 TaxID=3125778 RepID=UPI003CF2F92E
MKKFLKGLVISTLIFCMTCIPVFASEKTLEVKPDSTTKNKEVSSAVGASTITAPDGKTYTLLGTVTRGYTLKASLTSTVTASDNVQLKFYCPNNNRKDLIQGTVTAIPVLGGTQQTYSFMNFYDPLSTTDLSTLSGTSRYRIEIAIYAIGTSNQGTVYYRVEQK